VSVCNLRSIPDSSLLVRSIKCAQSAALVLAALMLLPAAVMAQGNATDGANDAAAKEFRQQLRALNWTVGPQQVQMFGNSTLQVPKDYLFLGTADAAKLEALEKQIPSGTHYFFAPKDFHWQVLFRYSDDGYVKDDDSIDADAILKSIREGTERANVERRNRGYDEMEVTGWQTPPHYDSQTHRLEWAIRGRDKRTNEEIVNFNTRILGRGGVMSVLLISSPESLTAGITELKGNLAGFDYLTGQRYAEYKPGDKIAKYGLAALITGGAAAIAVKTGLWKVIVGAVVAGWKFILAGIIALFGGISRFFKRKTA
jgi:uncharacterized membrane-anchored protein